MLILPEDMVYRIACGLTLVFVYLLLLPVTITGSQPDISLHAFSGLPFYFTENCGQFGDTAKVKFRLSQPGMESWFTPDGVLHQFCRVAACDSDYGRRPSESAPKIEVLNITSRFIGANPDAAITGVTETDYRCNYFIGKDESRWITNVPNYESVKYNDIYPGVDARYYQRGSRLEYDLIAEPGADLSQVLIDIEGAESISVTDKGDLIITTKWGEIRQLRPSVYQIDNSRRVSKAARFLTVTPTAFSFTIDDEISPNLPIVIDPQLSYAFYLGGSDDEFEHGYGGGAIASDSYGNAYVTGYTLSADFPTYAAEQDVFAEGHCDAFVTKINEAGDGLIYSTYLGGSGYDRAFDIAVDSYGDAYITGHTQSTDFPTSNPLQPNNAAHFDAFVTRISAAGDNLVYSTYLGGKSTDTGFGISVDQTSNAYVTGWTKSTDYPTSSGFGEAYAGYFDAFIVKLSPPGTELLYSTYIGGSDEDYGYGVTCDALGNAYVTGFTTSTDFPVVNAFQGSPPGSGDAFVAKIEPDGSGFAFCSYLGGSEHEKAWSVSVNTDGCVTVVGETVSSDFPTVNPLQGTNGGLTDAFIVTMSADGDSLLFGTYLGGDDDDVANSVACDNAGRLYLTGTTQSQNLTMVDPLQSEHGGLVDAFVAQIDTAGASMIFSTYLGGGGIDEGHDIASGQFERIYVSGRTSSSDFPVQGSMFQENNGYFDAFVVLFADTMEFICGDANGSSEVDIDDIVYLATWIFNAGPAPVSMDAADSTCDGVVDIDDIVDLIDFIFSGGPPPCVDC